MWCKSIFVVAFVLGSVAVASAQSYGGTPQEQAACRPDVGRLCKGVKNEQGSVLDCLKTHQNKLTRKCHAVLQEHGQIFAR